MVGVAQLVERRTVAPNVVGSNPIAHPNLLAWKQNVYASCFALTLSDFFSHSLHTRPNWPVGAASALAAMFRILLSVPRARAGCLREDIPWSGTCSASRRRVRPCRTYKVHRFRESV